MRKFLGSIVVLGFASLLGLGVAAMVHGEQPYHSALGHPANYPYIFAY